MKVAIASPPFPESIETGLITLEKLSADAADQGAEIICFPESFIPGYPLNGVPVKKPSQEQLQGALEQACLIARKYNITTILPMDWYEGEKFLNVAHVISSDGILMGYQSKNQLDPSEDSTWSAGTKRQLFEHKGLKFGITICHEGFRYPESVRWAAQNGAHIVFHPHLAGSDAEGNCPQSWAHPSSPYYEKAMIMRALENTVYFASSNYSFKYPDSTSSLIDPQGKCISYQPYAQPGIFVADIDPDIATGLLACRFKNELYYKA